MKRAFAAVVLFASSVEAATLAQKIDAYLAPYVHLHAFSGVVLAAKNDDVLATRAYGMANYEFGVPNTVDTRFRIASVTKRFTQIIVGRLVAEKKLRLEDTLDKWAPQFPSASKITIDQLLNHRSGIRDPNSLRRITPTNYTPADVLDLLAKEPLGSEPGATYSYTTANYAVLAYVVEKVTGQPFADVMREMVFEPAGMRDSGEIATTTVVPRLASGYMPDPFSDGVSVCGPEDTSWKAGGGSSYSTARDLFRFARHFANAATAEKSAFKRKYWDANGAFPGANANLTYFPDDGVTVVVLSNNYSPVAGAIAHDVAAMVFGEPYTVPSVDLPAKPIAPDPRILGSWSLEGYPPFQVVSRNGRDIIIWTTAREEALIPLGNDEYFAPLDFAHVKFDWSGAQPKATWSAPWSDRVLAVTRK